MKLITMKVVNRLAFTIRRRQPFLDWAAKTPPDSVRGSVKDLGRVTNVYLLSPPSDPNESDAHVARHMVAIFAAELSEWTRDMSRWPEPPGLDLFPEWFEMDYADIVVDLGARRIAAERP